jgi:hypothetical protein
MDANTNILKVHFILCSIKCDFYKTMIFLEFEFRSALAC